MACPDIPICPPCTPDYTDVGCCEFVKSSCVTYNGEDITCLNIEKNETLNEVITHLQDVICALTPTGYSSFDFGCFSTEGITTEQQFVEFISSVICEVLGTQVPGGITSLSDLEALIASLTVQLNLIKNQTLTSCFQTLSGLTTPQTISILLTAVQTILCDHEDRIVALESGSVNTNITVVNLNHDVELSASGTNNHTLSADVVLDPDGTNSITTSAAGILCSSPDITVVDTQSINFSASSTKNHTITGDVKISATANNAAVILADGVYVPSAALSETDLTAVDSTSIDFTTSGTNNHTITGEIILDPSLLNIAQITASGLFVSSALAQDPITPIDTQSINLTVSGGNSHTLRADVNVSPNANNGLQSLLNGLYVDNSSLTSGWQLTGNTTLSTDFLGTLTNQPLNFRVNNSTAGKIDSLGVSLFGYQAGFNNAAAQITAYGHRALYLNNTGGANSAFGVSALTACVSGDSNSAFGDYSLTAALDDRNTGFGYGTLQKMVTGTGNTAIGWTAGTNYGVGSELNGDYNTFIGAGSANLTGSPNISSSVAIGKNAFVSASNQVVLGGTGADAVSVVIGASTAVASAVLQSDSTTKGWLPPRMTGVQAEAIATPAEGLLVYSTDGTGAVILSKGWWGYNGATWVKLN